MAYIDLCKPCAEALQEKRIRNLKIEEKMKPFRILGTMQFN